MFVMLTPSLACAMTYCPMQSGDDAPMPCHQTTDDIDVMLALDCMGVDLMQQDADEISFIHVDNDSADYGWANILAVASLDLMHVNAIRGPPLIDNTLSSYHTAIIQKTQRFRV